jgi:hypothetical protein
MKKILNLKFIKIITFLLILIVVFSFSPQKPKSAALLIPFGGPILYIFPTCNLSASSAIVIGPPRPMSLSYQYGGSFSFA